MINKSTVSLLLDLVIDEKLAPLLADISDPLQFNEVVNQVHARYLQEIAPYSRLISIQPDARLYSPDAATVRRLVQATGLSTDECAERLGVSKRALNHWQSGAKDCPYSIHYCLTMLGVDQ